MNQKEDARVKKTKAKLIESFRKLISEKQFEDITVNDICARANVRRATFYKHYEDKYAFLKYFVGSLRDEFDKTIPKRKKPDATSAYYVEYIRGIVKFLTQNERIVKNVLQSAVLPSLIEVIKEKNFEDTCERLRKSVEEGMTLPASIEITAAMMTGAVANTLLAWFKSGKAMPVDELVLQISSVISSMQN